MLMFCGKIWSVEPKPIQDVAPPSIEAIPITLKPVSELPSGPEFVSGIPVRAQVGSTSQLNNPDTSFIVSDDKSQNKSPGASQPTAGSTQKVKSNTKPQPTAAIIVACLAAICLAAGAYFKFLANN